MYFIGRTKMRRRISMETQKEIVNTIRKRYKNSSNKEKTLIIDEFQNLTGFHRKHIIRLFNKKKNTGNNLKSYKYKIIYTESVKEIILKIWETLGRICSKRLKAAIPSTLESMEYHGHLKLDLELKKKVLNISASTIDRMLIPVKKKKKNYYNKRKKYNYSIKKQIPIRTFSNWDEPDQPGFLEVDLVSHHGKSIKGKYIYTLVVTDIASGWTSCVPILSRDQSLVVHALDTVRKLLPFEIIGIDTDNDSCFINETLLNYCYIRNIEQTRSRPYKSNDQAHIEQKNGNIVRRLVGYNRYEGVKSLRALKKLFITANAHINLFLPSFRLKEKIRIGGIGAKYKKIYDEPETPCERLLKNNNLKTSTKIKLIKIRKKLDPVKLAHDLHLHQEKVSLLAKHNIPENMDKSLIDFKEFVNHLPELWKYGEVRATHRKPEREKRTWRTREDPFAEAMPQIITWFEKDPDLNARMILEKLYLVFPEKEYSKSQLRTLQRRLKILRMETVEDEICLFNQQY
jgi:Integrase core domain